MSMSAAVCDSSIPQFRGSDGLNCRLTSSTFPSANHLFDAPH